MFQFTTVFFYIFCFCWEQVLSHHLVMFSTYILILIKLSNRCQDCIDFLSNLNQFKTENNEGKPTDVTFYKNPSQGTGLIES